MIPKQKIKNSDLILTCENAKNELSGFINDENKRINVDSAKKRAVLQGIKHLNIFFKLNIQGWIMMVLGKWF